MKNKERNKKLKERAEKGNGKYWYKRFGKCNPKKCAGACCRYNVITCDHPEEYFVSTFSPATGIFVERKKLLNQECVIGLHNCKNITVNGLCKLHGKKKQPYICDIFPMHFEDKVYQYVKKHCGYYFKKVKNTKYKKNKKLKSGGVSEV